MPKKKIPSIKITSPSLRTNLRSALGVKRLPSFTSLSTSKMMETITTALVKQQRTISKEQEKAIKQGLRDERSYQKQLKALHPYKKTIFGEEYKQVHIRAGKINRFVTTSVQNVDLEKQLRKVQRQYGHYSNANLETTGKGQGKVRVSKARMLYEKEGEQGVRRWLGTLSAKARNVTTEYNSIDLQQTLDTLNNLVWDSDDISQDLKEELDGLIADMNDMLVEGEMSFDDKNTLKNKVYTKINPDNKSQNGGYKNLTNRDVRDLIATITEYMK